MNLINSHFSVSWCELEDFGLASGTDLGKEGNDYLRLEKVVIQQPFQVTVVWEVLLDMLISRRSLSHFTNVLQKSNHQ